MAETTLTVARFVNVVSTVFRGFFQKFVAPYHVLNWLEGGGVVCVVCICMCFY